MWCARSVKVVCSGPSEPVKLSVKPEQIRCVELTWTAAFAKRKNQRKKDDRVTFGLCGPTGLGRSCYAHLPSYAGLGSLIRSLRALG